MALSEERRKVDVEQERIYPSFNDNHEFRVISGKDRLVIELGKSLIDVEVAKRPGKLWRHKEDIEQARASYKVVWGDTPTWDDYDRMWSTYNYIAYVHYPDAEGNNVITEAISNRMVTQNPEDIEFYQLNGIPLRDILREQFHKDKNGKNKIVAGESRIGAIRPPSSSSNIRTLEAFAAIKLKMAEDAREAGIDYIACQLRPDLSSSVFSVNGLSYDFPPTEDLLQAPRGSIRLNRNNLAVARHILSYPGYFLDANGVHETIKNLIDTGEISRQYFRDMTGLSDIKDLTKARNIKELVPLIKTDNPAGVLLRSKLLREVPDGTYSSVSRVDDIEERALRILKGICLLNS